jgi:two-component system, LytTR family, response regulator
MRALIVDDEPPARRKLRRLLEENGIAICGEADSGEEAISMIQRMRPDLVLLDITMPDMCGFRVLERVSIPQSFHVVFVTAHDDRALAAFEAQALDYLVKPVEPERFARTIARIKRLARAYPSQIQAGNELIATGSIEWAEAARNYVVIHAGGTHILRASLDSLAAKLDPEHFTRVSRSHLVNVRSIRQLEPAGHGERKILLRDGTELIWTRRYRDTLEAYLSRVGAR